MKHYWLFSDALHKQRNIIDPLESRGNYSITSNNIKLVHWPLMGGLLHLVQRGNVTAHPSTARVPITVLLRNGPLLCSVNVRIEALNATEVYRAMQSNWYLPLPQPANHKLMRLNRSELSRNSQPTFCSSSLRRPADVWLGSSCVWTRTPSSCWTFPSQSSDRFSISVRHIQWLISRFMLRLQGRGQ